MAYDLKFAFYEGKSFSVVNQDNSTDAIFFKPDGTKFYILGYADDKIYQYSLSTPWDITTASYENKSFDHSAQGTSFRDIFFRADGKKLYGVDSVTNDVFQYTLATAWDVTTGSYDSLFFDVNTQAPDAQGIFFKPDGTKFYVADDSTAKIYQYTLSTAWNVSTASYDDVSLSVNSQESDPRGVVFNANGSSLFIVGDTSASVFEYELGTNWDLSTAQYTNKSFVAPEVIVSLGLHFSSDGTKLYIMDDDHNTVYQYTTTSLYDRTKRRPAGSLNVSWKKDYRPNIVFFTIGVSSIGGNDLIKATEASDSQWSQYLYYDESSYLMHLDWEQALTMPIGGINIGMASGRLNNTSSRFSPRYIGGSSELFTAILPRRPFIINAGFEDSGVEILEPQFVGLFNRQPKVNLRERNLDFTGMDFINFLKNRFVDDESMYTGQRTDQLIETILQNQGFATSQYELDTGISTVPFAIFKRGQRFGDIIDELVKAEYGHFYQDETGKLRFENRQHWDSTPHTEVQWVLYSSQVIDAEVPDDDHIINVVEVKAQTRAKQSEQTIYRLNTLDSILIPANTTKEVFIDFEDPVLSVTTPSASSTTSFFKGNSESDGSGTDTTSSLSIPRLDKFAQAAKLFFLNSSSSDVYVTELVVSGRPAKILNDIYYRGKDDSSVTAYEERVYRVENNYIQDSTWAQSLAEMIILDYAEPENLQTVKVRAIPEIKLGDLVSWQGRDWRVFGKRNALNPSVGFIQELTLLQRDIVSYFRIGISTVGSADRIAP